MKAFGRLLRVPHVTWLLVTATVARLPYGIEGLATVLYVHAERGSFATAGAVSASGAVAAGIGLPVLGRVIDAVGQTRVLLVTLVVHACAGAVLIALVEADAPTVALCAACAVGGFAVPPISPALRSLWPDVLGDDERALRSAMALDAISIEFVFIAGPLLTAIVVATVSPVLAVALGYAFAAGGALAFATLEPSRRWRGSGTGRFGLGPLTARGLQTLLAVSLPCGIALGTLEVGLPAFGVAEESASAGAVAIACLSVGSAAGGLWYGARAPQQLVRAFVLLSAALAAGIALLAVPSSVALMFLLAPIAGAALAPLTAASNELAGRVAPAGTVTEAYAWVVTALVVGVAAGTAIGGAIIESASWREAVLLGAAAAGVGALVAAVRRATLITESMTFARREGPTLH